MAKAEAKAEKGASDDPSMEDILQSIRRIIAEDGDDPKAAAPAAAANDEKKESAGEAPGSDVLELTEMVKDDGTVVSLKTETAAEPAPAAAVAPQPAPAKEAAPADVLGKIDEALAAPAPVAAKPVDTAVISQEAATAATATINKLKDADTPPPPKVTPSPGFASGRTVEDMVMEMLKPMMKEWLDKNLSEIVKNVVEREIKKLTR